MGDLLCIPHGYTSIHTIMAEKTLDNFKSFLQNFKSWYMQMHAHLKSLQRKEVIPFSFWLTAVKESSGLTVRWFMGAPNLGRNSWWWVLYCHITNTPSSPPESILEPTIKVWTSYRGATTAWSSPLKLESTGSICFPLTNVNMHDTTILLKTNRTKHYVKWLQCLKHMQSDNHAILVLVLL